MTDQEQNQLLAGLRRTRDLFQARHGKTPEQSMRRRTSQRDRDLMDAFRNR